MGLAPELSDGQIRLTGFGPADVEDHLSGEDDEHAKRFGWYPERSTILTVTAAIERWQHQWTTGGRTRAFAVRSISHGKLVGGVELRLRDEDVADISYWVNANFRRQGIAARATTLASEYAFAKLGVERIEALIEPDNVGSLQTALKVGFTNEGLLRSRSTFGSERRDMVILGLIPSDLATP